MVDRPEALPLAFDQQGPAKGPVLVLLHGFPFDRGMWSEQVAAFGDRWRLIVPDLRGHGQSPLGSDPVTMDLLADDVVGLLDTLGVATPVVVAGLSMGGYVTLALAANHPSRVQGLILIDTKASPDTPEAAAGREDLARKVEQADSTQPVASAMVPKLFAPDTLANRPELVERIRGTILATAPATVAATLRGLAGRPDRRPALAGWDWPALAIVGEHDVITTPDDMKTLADALPKAELVRIPDAGHLAPLEQPEAVNRAIGTFLDRIGPA